MKNTATVAKSILDLNNTSVVSVCERVCASAIDDLNTISTSLKDHDKSKIGEWPITLSGAAISVGKCNDAFAEYRVRWRKLVDLPEVSLLLLSLLWACINQRVRDAWRLNKMLLSTLLLCLCVILQLSRNYVETMCIVFYEYVKLKLLLCSLTWNAGILCNGGFLFTCYISLSMIMHPLILICMFWGWIFKHFF